MPDINIREENKVETLSSRYPRLGPATRFLWLILVGGPITDTSVKSCVRNAHVLRDFRVSYRGKVHGETGHRAMQKRIEYRPVRQVPHLHSGVYCVGLGPWEYRYEKHCGSYPSVVGPPAWSMHAGMKERDTSMRRHAPGPFISDHLPFPLFRQFLGPGATKLRAEKQQL
jgi:hypothetical protein